MWLAGGGIRGGITHGATDELGYHAVEDVVSVTTFTPPCSSARHRPREAHLSGSWGGISVLLTSTESSWRRPWPETRRDRASAEEGESVIPRAGSQSDRVLWRGARGSSKRTVRPRPEAPKSLHRWRDPTG